MEIVYRVICGDLSYHISDTKNSFYPNKYYVKDRSQASGSYLSEEEFLKFSKNMVQPKVIDTLHNILIRKIIFQILDKSRQPKKQPMEWGFREVGDWPQERLTNLDFEAIMNNTKIVECMQNVDPNDLLETKEQERTPQ